MTTIHLSTNIYSSIETCFDLARSVDAHILSTQQTNEKAIAGRLTGLCELGDEITWQAKHFGIVQKLSVRITQMNPPRSFEDQMTKGAFQSFRHQHLFAFANGITTMTDEFCYEVPFGFVGRLFDKLVLKKYMTNLLLKRNDVLKALAEKKCDYNCPIIKE
jgi:ligand-binding SRPBCC domain-containing protein